VSNVRFSDYVTSGAFQMALTRSQIAALSMIVGGEDRYVPSGSALERKGLIAPVEGKREGLPLEYRLTAAGALTLALLHQAGLTNDGADVMAREMEALRAELDMARKEAKRADERARSLNAKLAKIAFDIRVKEARTSGNKLPCAMLPRDPLPEMSAEAILEECRKRTELYDPALEESCGG